VSININQRWALAIEYDGTFYHGWQRQTSPEQLTVQQVLETALSAIANRNISVVCAGRTDSGVHALGQVIHFDTHVARNAEAWVLGTNRYLPPGVRVLWAKPVACNFHARYSAIARRYLYLINTHPIRPALLHNRVTWHRKPLNIEAMQEAAKYLLGEHDFSAYRAADCQAKSPVRRITHLHVRQTDKQTIALDVQANAFLHHMVRNISGVLMKIGVGERPPEWAETVLHSRDRKQGGITAPPEGLYLHSVVYSEDFFGDFFNDSFLVC
jgi:tRNA pseudouridine38-40 synthase